MNDTAGPIAAGQVVSGRFRVIRQLGEGGMGAVYEVEHELTKHRRALKVLHRDYVDMPEAVSRFLREASAAGRIGSDHIVETFDAGQLPGGEPYLVMELLTGETLAQRLARMGRLSVDDALEIVRQAATGIQAAHDAGIVHRDLKPDNLFVVRSRPELVKILDFGISKFDPELTGTPSLTTDGSALGTPYYMSPEQVRGDRAVGAQSDVYALGVVLYECLTGKPPFEAETLPALCVLIHEGDYTPPRQLRPELSPAVEQVVTKAMARDRGDRFATAGALAGALQALGERQAAQSMADTLAVSSAALTVRSDGARARSLAPPPAEAPQDHVRTQLSRDVEQARGRRSWILLAALALLIAGVTAFAFRRGPSPPAATQEPVAAQPDPEPTAPAPLPSETPEPRATSSAEPADAALAAPTTDARTDPPAKVSQPVRESGKPKPSYSRAKEHGLGTEDPFAK